MVRLVGLEPTTGKTPVDFKPTAYANFATAAPATRHPENITRGNHPHNLSPHSKMNRGRNFREGYSTPAIATRYPA